jgi:hypothetical protein
MVPPCQWSYFREFVIANAALLLGQMVFSNTTNFEPSEGEVH